MLVYRDGKRDVRPSELRDELACSLRRVAAASFHATELLLTALMRAGELECVLTDQACEAAPPAAELTDAVADALLTRDREKLHLKDAKTLWVSRLPATARVSVPEGFAYYALDPLGYAAAAESVTRDERPVLVIGLRTIGTTLSAVVAGAARRLGRPAERFTVRPGGHPFDRRTEFSPEQRRVVAAGIERRARFLVVDEGPGLSGSSLLAVADALRELGVANDYIVVLCAHAPNAATLRAPRAADRWAQLRVAIAARISRAPADAVDWSGGLWRAHLYPDVKDWPAMWPQVERLKFLSRDGERVYKFEGLGPYGESALERARAAAEAGFSPPLEAEPNGFAAYRRIDGCPLTYRDLDAAMLDTLARYCDFRARETTAERVSVEPLREMLRINVREEFGVDEAEAGDIAKPVIADGRMMPHEWLRDGDGRVWKTDVASHGDDHFYPGPTDIAWDLAGAIVEWRMDGDAREIFLARYRHLSGDDAAGRLPFFLRAYSAFRMGFCRMAAESCAEERARLSAAAEYYRQSISQSVGQQEHRLSFAAEGLKP